MHRVSTSTITGFAISFSCYLEWVGGRRSSLYTRCMLEIKTIDPTEPVADHTNSADFILLAGSHNYSQRCPNGFKSANLLDDSAWWWHVGSQKRRLPCHYHARDVWLVGTVSEEALLTAATTYYARIGYGEGVWGTLCIGGKPPQLPLDAHKNAPQYKEILGIYFQGSMSGITFVIKTKMPLPIVPGESPLFSNHRTSLRWNFQRNCPPATPQNTFGSTKGLRLVIKRIWAICDRPC